MKLPGKLGYSSGEPQGPRPNSNDRKRAKEKRERDSKTGVLSRLDEERRPIPGFEGHYEISRKGDVYSMRLGRFVKRKLNLEQQPYIGFTINGEKHILSIRKTVAAAFADSPEARRSAGRQEN
jgi:hypothetical protein